MCCARALPINQLVPAVSSCQASAATPALVDLPERMRDRQPLAARTPGIPSIIMSPDFRPWTQIRLGAGPRNASFASPLSRGRQA